LRSGLPRLASGVLFGWVLVSGAVGSLVACAPPLERTPPAPGRNDAMVATAQAPAWKPGDTWRYRGRTFDSHDNRFYVRVVRQTQEGGRDVYEVDTPRYVEFIDARTLRPVRHRSKETGQTEGAMTLNPLFFPLNFSTRFSASGTRAPEGEAMRPYSEACRVVNYEDVVVHAGTFAAFRIDCETKDGFAEHWYAPEVRNLVKMRWMAERESFRAELWDYYLGQ
jgi:hypothetical protein